ncbi:uncharacterized protein LOC116171379 isoform X1 [Photinus pyralis]|uniref:CCHC-type domain-containing protein n=2 Tax=Photinus pyralis TaxID=7054 RepID=A0A1Y1JYG3_PHOPY|nr:uncharacterized protein LOC116171379 isoform X1 [Photinus pyralis]XP_031344037.1 uncharacterized protein LOC116171379 isoform X1 [Photinus pyralis]
MAMPDNVNVTVVNTGNISNIKTFNIGDDWEIFVERLDQYLIANRVEEERKGSILITSVSEEVYKIMKNLCYPEKPFNKTYAALCTLLEDQFKQKVSLFRKRIIFDNLRQGEETINEWYVKVRRAAAECEFGTLLDERIKDKFVVGLKPGAVLNRMCEEKPTKSIAELVEVALAKEAALRESRSVEVHQVRKAKEDSTSKRWQVQDRKKFDKSRCTVEEKKSEEVSEARCFHCNKTKHDFKLCKFKQYVCAKCKTKGHIAAACKRKVKDNHFIDEEDDDDVNVETLKLIRHLLLWKWIQEQVYLAYHMKCIVNIFRTLR